MRVSFNMNNIITNKAHNFRDLKDKKFNRLKVIKEYGKNNQNEWVWECKCDCGNIEPVYVRGSALTTGTTKSCGCLRREKTSNMFKKHNMSNSKIYKAWCHIKERCYNNNICNYNDYGGRGITVCDRWLESFENFRDDMYKSYLDHVEEYGKKNTSIDRIDVDGNYCKDNCRWATNSEQMNNRRDLPSQKLFKAISPEGVEYIDNNCSKFSKVHNLNCSHMNKCINKRIGHNSHKGWRFELLI